MRLYSCGLYTWDTLTSAPHGALPSLGCFSSLLGGHRAATVPHHHDGTAYILIKEEKKINDLKKVGYTIKYTIDFRY